eukprot:TRINITY_DN192_c0_g2_i1.p1 TRINITY_DN192_c0_g2~~TRINITY_DN192_c0_g2_i1.p1  ORF type:complete len:410 (+),score=59.66 TRINITY_DN192_c0_g2_i1:105-1334(+)
METTTMQQSTTAYHCKVFFKDEVRRIQLRSPSFNLLLDTLRTLLSLDPLQTISVKYNDDEGDLVTLTSDMELEAAFSFIAPNTVLRVHVSVDVPINASNSVIIPKTTSQSFNRDETSAKPNYYPGFGTYSTPHTSSPYPYSSTQSDKIVQISNSQKLAYPGSTDFFNASSPSAPGQYYGDFDPKNRDAFQSKKEWKRNHKEGKHSAKRELHLAKKEQKRALAYRFNARFDPPKMILTISSQTPLSIKFTITNVGSTAWPSGTCLSRFSKCKSLALPSKIDLPGVIEPMSSVPLELSLQYTPNSDMHKSKWKVMLPDGTKIGPKFIFKVKSTISPDRKVGNGGRYGQGRRWEGQVGGCGRGPRGGQWAMKIQQLREMGFEGQEVFRLMRQYGGDVNAVASALLSAKQYPK